ncbi:nitrate- and nitrite sensing domain-containing protein [Streptomyces pathocidini]|uniref:sensor histidine kinase n=1 Tax=Streptomyces pathocidini TaxID=1650571 RepID=UPI003404073B
MRNPRTTPGGDPPQLPPPARGRRAHAGPPAEEEAPRRRPSGGEPLGTGRWRLRPRSVRAKIVCLLMVPVVSLLGLWAFATVGTAQDVAALRQSQRVDAKVRAPVAAAVDALQLERRAALRQLAEPGTGRATELDARARATAQAVQRLRLGDRDTVAVGMDLPADVPRRLGAFVTSARQLAELRTGIDDRAVNWDDAYAAYTDTIAAGLGVGGALADSGAYTREAGQGTHARVLLELARGRELLAREDALLSSAQLTGALDRDRHRRFTGAMEARRAFEEASAADLSPADHRQWRDIAAGGAYAQVRAVEDKVLRADPGTKAAAAAPATAWDRSYATLRDELRNLENDASTSAAEHADPFAHGLMSPAGAAVLLGLVAVLASLAISVRIGRGLVVELVTLRNSALEIARHKLPNAMRRLRTGQEIDIHTEAPPGPPAEDEVAQVGEALSTVHRAALRAAAERAELASGVSGVFVNLARRSQVLVHRQLALLDGMERRAEDPNELGDLFRLDHLTTRMRRHAESLIILSGAAPGRAWRLPVPLTNVVRAAVSEVEDYARVEVRPLPEAAVAGGAVADLTHLLAELVENAAQFSPPHTKVRVTGEPVGNGYALEVEDRGLGMGEETLEKANRRIAQSEALDLFDSDRLGLFVVSRLSARHGIQVTLHPSAYGGTTAVVLLPKALLHTVPAYEQDDRKEPVQEPLASVPYEQPPRLEVHVNGGARPNGRPVALPGQRPAPSGPSAAPPRRVIPARRDSRSADGARSGGPGDSGLPRRVRQASLAPQLRETPAPQDPPAAVQQADEPEERTPEQVRARMTAYRDGWVRGGGASAARPSEGDQE